MELKLLKERLELARASLEVIIPTLDDEDARDYRVLEGAGDVVKGVSEIVHYSKQNKEA